MKDCIYVNCDRLNSSKCNTSCIRFMETNFLLDHSNIPIAKRKKTILTASNLDIEAFSELNAIREDIINFTDGGENILIHSEIFGNGKTSWAVKLMLNYISKVWAGNGFTRRCYFVHVPTYLSQIRSQISNYNEAFAETLDILATLDLVVFDDLGSTKLSEYDSANLLLIIDQRLFNNKANIFTSNLSITELKYAVGSRLADRVWHGSQRVELKGCGKRGIK